MTGTYTDKVAARTILKELDGAAQSVPEKGGEFTVSFRQNGTGVGRRDSATHWIHWYPAKMFHRIPSEIMDTIGLPPRATILDPFCGSGTVLLEANLRGHDAIGLDINPLAQLISRVKTIPLDPQVLQGQLEQVKARSSRSRVKPDYCSTLDSWISWPARVGLHRLHVAISEIPDADYRDFFRVALTSIVRKVSLADPAIPPLVRLSHRRGEFAGPSYRQALAKSRSITTPEVQSTFLEIAAANVKRMAELYDQRFKLGSTQIISGDHDATATGLGDWSVDMIITSPPYCGSQKYVRSLKLELLLSGCSLDRLRHLDQRTMGTEAVTRRVTPVQELLTGDDYVDGLVRDIYNHNPVRARMASDYSKSLFEFTRECRRVP